MGEYELNLAYAFSQFLNDAVSAMKKSVKPPFQVLYVLSGHTDLQENAKQVNRRRHFPQNEDNLRQKLR
jgi:hypothetical protein